jgi:hypothetical protein
MVARLEVDDALADRLHDPGTLMSEDDRKRRRVDSLDDMQIGMTNAARRHAHEHLARLRRVELELLDDERLVELVEDGGPESVGH